MSTISEEEFSKITSLPTMAQLLPYVFENGSRIDGMTISCSICEGDVPPEHAHGEIVEYGASATLKAHLLCYDCAVISPFECRLRNDGTLLIKGDNSWTEARYAPEPGTGQALKNLIESVKQFLGKTHGIKGGRD